MNNRKFPRAAFLALALACLSAAALLTSPRASTQGRQRVREAAEHVLQSFDELTLEPASLLREVRKTGRVTLETSRGAFELEVEPFDILADDYRAVAVREGGVVAELPRPASRSYRGRVVGMEDTFVRLVLDEQTLEGIIITPDEHYYVETARRFSAGAGARDFVFYAASAVKDHGGECGTTLAERVSAEASRAGLRGGAPSPATKGLTPDAAFSPKPQTDIATEADFEFYSFFNNEENTNASINNVMTQVDGIYDSQMGIKIRVTFQRVWTTNTDPYTLTNGSAALNEFRTTYDATFGGAPPERDLTHLFTGKDIEGGTIGIAYIAAVCDAPAFSYGISQSGFQGSPATTIIGMRVALTAHEMGHNFSASHPNQETPPVGGECINSIMHSSITSSNQFCQFSRDQITNHVAGTGGACLTRLAQPGCTYSLTTGSQFFPASGGAGVVGVTTAGDCEWSVAEGTPWVSISSGGSGVGPGQAAFTVGANTGGPREALLDIAGQKLRVRQAASAGCSSSQINIGQAVAGTLADTDCRSGQAARPNAPIDLYTFVGRAGQRIRIEMTAAVKPTAGELPEELDTFLYLFSPDGSIFFQNDDIGGNPHNTDSRIPFGGFLPLPSTGIYTIEATSFDDNDNGAYTLTLSDNSSTNNVAFSTAAYAVSESLGGDGLGTDAGGAGLGQRVITVNRGGTDVSGTASVDYATSNGTADARKDYTEARGTLVFGPGQSTKSFTVFVEDDRFAEGPETVNVTLSNPVGTTLGTPSTATLTIDSNDGADAPSPVRLESLDTAFFVRQQYLDFFSREPDPAGFAFWQSNINGCGANQQCRDLRRINVSAAFFLSIEFQETGYLVYRTYKAAYGDATSPNVAGTVPVIRLQEFLPDTQRISQNVVVNVGNWEEQLEANKRAFMLEFVLRQRFLNEYPLSMTPEQFVAKMIEKTGPVVSDAERNALVAQLSASADVAAGRAAVLRQLAEDADLKASEFRRAFVLMQFYGYMRRNPDDPQDTDFRGWKFWLDKLNQFNGNFVQAEMVKAFLNSDEYIDRFGTRP